MWAVFTGRRDFSREMFANIRNFRGGTGRYKSKRGTFFSRPSPQTSEISHFCPRNASTYIIFPINSSGRSPSDSRLASPRLASPRSYTYARFSFSTQTCADSRAKRFSATRTLLSRFCKELCPFYHPSNVNLLDGYIYISNPNETLRFLL